MAEPLAGYDPTFDARADFIWPELRLGKIVVAPVRVGMNAQTGAMMVGWDHVVQSAGKIFATRYHERILRRWVGSFIPHLLGENAVPHVITRFFWAIASALDMWEPNYHIKRVRTQARSPSEGGGALTSDEDYRKGQMTFLTEGVYMPRGHLGDPTPEQRRTMGLVDRGDAMWTRSP